MFALARLAFKDSPGECQFVSKKGKHLQSRQEAYIACKGWFVGMNTAKQECDMVGGVIAKVQYK